MYINFGQTDTQMFTLKINFKIVKWQLRRRYIMDTNNNKIFKTITREKIEELEKLIFGLDKSEWNYIKGSIDMYFNEKAAKLKIDDFDMLDNYLNRKY